MGSTNLCSNPIRTYPGIHPTEINGTYFLVHMYKMVLLEPFSSMKCNATIIVLFLFCMEHTVALKFCKCCLFHVKVGVPLSCKCRGTFPRVTRTCKPVLREQNKFTPHIYIKIFFTCANCMVIDLHVQNALCKWSGSLPSQGHSKLCIYIYIGILLVLSLNAHVPSHMQFAHVKMAPKSHSIRRNVLYLLILHIEPG